MKELSAVHFGWLSWTIWTISEFVKWTLWYTETSQNNWTLRLRFAFWVLWRSKIAFTFNHFTKSCTNKIIKLQITWSWNLMLVLATKSAVYFAKRFTIVESRGWFWIYKIGSSVWTKETTQFLNLLVALWHLFYWILFETDNERFYLIFSYCFLKITHKQHQCIASKNDYKDWMGQVVESKCKSLSWVTSVTPPVW